MKVFCVAGKAGCGKDTAARHLRELLEERGATVLVTHYADLVKYVAKTFAGWDGEKDAIGRSILQCVGTELFRTYDENYWVDFVADVLAVFHKWDYVLIPDTRFPNEIDRLKARGFDVTAVRIERPRFESALTETQQNHVSETALDDYIMDYIVYNDSTEEMLSDNLRVMLEDMEEESSDWHQISFEEIVNN